MFSRNPEIKRQSFIYLLVTIIASTACFIYSIKAGLFCLILCAVFSALHFVSVYNRYKKISSLSSDIDSALHGKNSVDFSDYSEGELAVLQSEIKKLIIELREQASQLKNDKIHLANSLADISHQIRTPLTSINIITTMLSKRELTEEKRLELVKQLEMLLSRIDWLISSLLKMSKLDAGTADMTATKISVAEVIRCATEPIAIPMELRAQSMDVNISGDESFIGDFKWTVEAVGNILKNCMEHTPVGGKIEVIASENAIFTEIIISDNGSGIDKEDLPHLFERFYKGKSSSEHSVGIGLALARMIITNQNGTIKAGISENCGAMFTIRFYKGAK